MGGGYVRQDTRPLPTTQKGRGAFTASSFSFHYTLAGIFCFATGLLMAIYALIASPWLVVMPLRAFFVLQQVFYRKAGRTKVVAKSQCPCGHFLFCNATPRSMRAMASFANCRNALAGIFCFATGWRIKEFPSPGCHVAMPLRAFFVLQPRAYWPDLGGWNSSQCPCGHFLFCNLQEDLPPSSFLSAVAMPLRAFFVLQLLRV